MYLGIQFLKVLGVISDWESDLNFYQHSAYLGQVLVCQKMQFSRFEAILTFAFVEKVGLEFSTGVFFCGRHYF